VGSLVPVWLPAAVARQDGAVGWLAAGGRPVAPAELRGMHAAVSGARGRAIDRARRAASVEPVAPSRGRHGHTDPPAGVGGAAGAGTAPGAALYALTAETLLALAVLILYCLICASAVVRSVLLVSLLERPG